LTRLLARVRVGSDAQRYRPRTMSMPERTSSSFKAGSLPTRSVRYSLSTLTTSDTLATESFASPVRRFERCTLPGAKAHLRLVVNGTQTTVATRLRLSESDCTTTTGLRNPGPDPSGAGRSAHQISPCEITTRFASGCGGKRRRQTDPSVRPLHHRPGSLFL